MKKIFTIVFIMITVSVLHSYTIDETLQQINLLNNEIAQNELLVEHKISELKQNNPLFAEQDPFESDSEYLSRMSKAMPQINQLRKQYLEDLCQKMRILRSSMFETQNIQIDIDPKNYDPNTEKWPVTIHHLDYQKEVFPISLNISKIDASELYKNWNKVKKTSILAIDVGDKIGLAKLILENPITQFKLVYEFQPMISFKHNSNLNSVAFSNDGLYLASGGASSNFSGYINIINLNTNDVIKSYSCKNRVYSVIFSPDGKFLACGGGDNYYGYIRIYDMGTGNEVKTFKLDANVFSLSFSPDGKFLATGCSDNNAHIYNLETGNEVKSFKHSASVYSVAFSPDGKFLATGSNDYYARIYNLETGNEVKSFKHSGRVYSVAFSPDGKFLATGSGGAHIYNLETGNEVKSFGHASSVAFSPDGKFLATGSGGARIYNLETGNEVKSFEHASSVAFSPDGKFLATGSGDFAYLYRTLFQPEEEVLAQKSISRPPVLSANVSFIEPSGNRFLEALETGLFKVTITNSGEGSGNGILVKINPERTENLNYNNTYIKKIDPGKTFVVEIPIEAYIGIADADHTFRFNFEEINGFPPNPVEIQFSTKAYLKPEMFIVDVGIEDGNSNGMIESGEMINVTVRLGNKGKGTAIGSYAIFYTGDNVFITDSYTKTVSLGDIGYNGQIDVPLEFFVNDKTKDEIPLYVDITESTGLATVSKLRIPIKKSDKVQKIQRTVITGIDKEYGDLNFADNLSIDIEQSIPEVSKKNKNAIAIVLGIENYRNVSDVNFALRDATIMKEYFSKTIGIPEEQIYFKANDEVTLGEFRKIFSDNGWLDKRVIENDTDVYFYYAGHGAPAIKEEKAFLIPFDGDPNYPVQTGYSLDTVYNNLSKLNANSVTVFLDACFTGANRENEMLLADARPVSIQLKNTYVNNITVFSATSSNEISSSYPQNKHGLFSYFLMKGMQGKADVNNDNRLTIQELFDFVKTNVSRTAGMLDREQTPQLNCLDPNKEIIRY
jgi:WD40 repeat protein